MWIPCIQLIYNLKPKQIHRLDSNKSTNSVILISNINWHDKGSCFANLNHSVKCKMEHTSPGRVFSVWPAFTLMCGFMTWLSPCFSLFGLPWNIHLDCVVGYQHLAFIWLKLRIKPDIIPEIMRLYFSYKMVIQMIIITNKPKRLNISHRNFQIPRGPWIWVLETLTELKDLTVCRKAGFLVLLCPLLAVWLGQSLVYVSIKWRC